MTSKDDIRLWLKRGIEMGATHVIVVCDTFDYQDYPAYVTPEEDAKKRRAEEDQKPMQRVMEVYSLALPIEAQLAEERAFHFEAIPQ